ncbi:hypothetical protein AAC03nite_34840 [Alicyclobacillus acidoterrestris]|nr:hypothetical protein N007_11175 [Alicyclobacillus acidoterrestris ATCC 49025]GEO27699.1 hypothetical protein AAC03nite_34840 [Alicyclobacillus acidoterrestris]
MARRFYQEVCSEKPILVLAHRTELLDQAESKLNLVWPGVMTGRVQGARNEQLAEVILASTQTLVAGRSIPEPGLIIYDECHHSRAEGAFRILQDLGVFREDGPPLLGVTATPSRSDGSQIGDVFEHVTYERTILEMVMDGYLTDVRGLQVNVPNLDFRYVRTSGGDYSQQDLSATLNHDIALNAVVEAYVQYARYRKSVVFAVDVAHANSLAERFKLAGYAAASVDGSMSAEQRARILSDFSNNKLKILVNCSLLTEGWDEPSVDCVVIGRPTKSQALYTQMIGRAIRLHPGKNDALVLDLTGASEDKNLQTFTKLITSQSSKQNQERRSSDGSKRKTKSGEPEFEKQTMMTGESVTEWLQRVRELEQQENKFIEHVNLFANRTRYHWERIKNHFAISYGDGHWAFLIEEQKQYWPVLDIGNSRYLPLHDESMPLEYAQGVAEGFLELLESKVIAKDADWRNARMSARQEHLLELYHIPHRADWTRGMASDALNKKFAKREIKKVCERFVPERWREAWKNPVAKEKYERMVLSIREQAQQQRRAAQ